MRPSSVRAVIRTEGSSGLAPLRSPPLRSCSFSLAATSRSSTVTTVPLKSCFSHCVAPMRSRSPTAISSGSVTRPSTSRLTSMTARLISVRSPRTRSRIRYDSARASARVRARTMVDLSGSARTCRAQSSTNRVRVFSSSWHKWSRPRTRNASIAAAASPSRNASDADTCHGVKEGLSSIVSYPARIASRSVGPVIPAWNRAASGVSS